MSHACPRCGKKVTNRGRNNPAIYCSRTCKSAAATSRRISRHPRDQEITRRCLFCQEEFTTPYHTKLYCQHHCYTLAGRRRRRDVQRDHEGEVPTPMRVSTKWKVGAHGTLQSQG